MLTDLIILGILCRKKQHGYEIKKQIEFEMKTIDIQFGSIYHALSKFSRQGLVEQVPIGQSPAGKPDRKGYKITKKGEDYFKQLLYTVSLSDSDLYTAGEIILHFINFISPADIHKVFYNRLKMLKERLKVLDGSQQTRREKGINRVKAVPNHELDGKERQILNHSLRMMPFIFEQAFNHQKILLENEIIWTKNLIKDLKI